MPIIKYLNAKGKYADDMALHDVISYILQPHKTPNCIIGCTDGAPQYMAQKMAAVSLRYNKYSKVRLRHFVVSFLPGEISSLSILENIGYAICHTIGCAYQAVYALHEDTDTPHIHFVFNAVSYVNGERYRGDKQSHRDLIHCVKSILSHFGIIGAYEVRYHPETTNPHE